MGILVEEQMNEKVQILIFYVAWLCGSKQGRMNATLPEPDLPYPNVHVAEHVCL